jgi:hypothetical protein
MEMISLFTETLDDLLKNKGYGTASQDAALTEILSLMGKFPNFTFGEDLNISMTDLFMHKFDIREIGAETEELFMHYWKERINELLIKYVPKITMWLDNFNDLFKFTVELTTTNNLTNANTNSYYLNPVNANSEKLSNKDTSTETKTGTVKREVLQTVWGKTRAMILEQILNLKDVYNDCLNEFEVIFMGAM